MYTVTSDGNIVINTADVTKQGNYQLKVIVNSDKNAGDAATANFLVDITAKATCDETPVFPSVTTLNYILINPPQSDLVESFAGYHFGNC